MNRYKKHILILLILCCCVGCDQVTKELAEEHLQNLPAISWCYDTVRIQYVRNSGAFLSLGASLSDNFGYWILIVIPGIFLCGLFVFIVKSSRLEQEEIIALSLLLGGGISNLLDRIFQNRHVTDFLNIGIGRLRTGIFNIADVLILLGAGGFILLNLRHYLRDHHIIQHK